MFYALIFDFCTIARGTRNSVLGIGFCVSICPLSNFGICCEGLPRQINYLLGPTSNTGKGANTMSDAPSLLAVHGLGETAVYLHGDNCIGQNNNSNILQHLLWRVMVGLHHSIVL